MPETQIDMGLVSAPPTLATEAAPAIAPAPQPAPAPARVTPGSPEWSALSTEQRHAQLRGPENPRANGHSPAVEQRHAAAERQAGAPETPPAAPGAQTEHSTERLKVGKYEVSEAELAGMLDRQARDDQRRLTLPETPDAYKLEVSPGTQLPGNVEYKFDPADPSLVALKNWAHAKNLDQAALSELLTVYATHEAQQQATLAARAREEIAKAGANAPQRVDAVGRWITGEMGEADAAPIKAMIVTDAQLRFYEKLMNRAVSQGAASFSQQHRAAPEQGIPGYEKMTFEQRRAAQDQIAARRR